MGTKPFDYTDARGRYYFRYQNVGLKLIPKCGSTSVRIELGGGEALAQVPVEEYLGLPVRLTVIRNPFERLMSLYTSDFIWKPGLKGQKRFNDKYKIPLGCTRRQFLEAILALPDERRDWHFQSFHQQAPYLDSSEVVPIEHWPKVAKEFRLPVLEKRHNQSDPARKSRNDRGWTPEEVALIASDQAYYRDFDEWDAVNKIWSLK